MLMLLRVVGEAVAAQALRALAGQAAMSDHIYEIASEVIRKYKESQRSVWIADDVRELLQASPEDVRLESAAIANDVAAGQPDAIITLLDAYLAQLPAVARQGLKRPNDPTGTTIPNELNLLDPVHFATLLPRRAPRFRAADAVPHAQQWRFVELLGAGGFGEVWLARHDLLGKRAFKFCLDPASRERLLRHEGQVVKRVMDASSSTSAGDHGVVKLLDAYLDGDAPWLAYEYIDGGDLTAVARELSKKTPEERGQQALAILSNLASVVAQFHRLPHPVIHRDLKPANVLVQKYRDRFLLRVTDFGISHIAADQSVAAASTISTPSMTLGATFRGAHTPIYSSPQQKRGEKASVKDDVFALGIIGFQLLMADLTRERPSGKSWRKQLAECNLNVKVLDFLASCWDDEPEERPADAADFVYRLELAKEGKDPPGAPSALVEAVPVVPDVPPAPVGEVEVALQPLVPLLVEEAKPQAPVAETAVPQPVTEPAVPPPASRPRVKKTQSFDIAMTQMFGSIESDYEAWLASFNSTGDGTREWLMQNEDNVRVWSIAAARGIVSAFPLMGCAFQHGVGVRQDSRAAFEWFRKAAEAGNVTAMNELGTFYYKGVGVEKNYGEALNWYRKAFDEGNLTSLCWLGWMHCNGHGVRKDYAEAMRCFREAAEAGNPIALFAIGTMYDQGNGVKKNLAEAMSWYRRACEAGHEDACRVLEQMDASR